MVRTLSRVLRTIGCATVLVVLTASPAHASESSYIDTIVAQVADDQVYVEEGVPYTTSTTEANLASRLTDTDNLVLVALSDPSSTIDDPAQFVRELGEVLGAQDDTVVLGVTIGSEAYTYSNYIPALDVSDMMHRSKTVSTNPEEVLGTYTAYVHSWQLAHPEPEPAITSAAGMSPLVAIVMVALGAAVSTFFTRRFIKRRKKLEGIRIGVIPRPLRSQVVKLMELRQKITAPNVREDLYQIAQDIEYYFKRRRRNARAVSAQLSNDLKHVITALEGYITVQNGNRYFPKGSEHMQQTAHVVSAVAEQALKLVQGGVYEELSSSFGATELLQITNPSSLFR